MGRSGACRFIYMAAVFSVVFDDELLRVSGAKQLFERLILLGSEHA